MLIYPLGNDPREFIFGDLFACFTPEEQRIIATLSYPIEPIPVTAIAEICGVNEPTTRRALKLLTNRSIYRNDRDPYHISGVFDSSQSSGAFAGEVVSTISFTVTTASTAFSHSASIISCIINETSQPVDRIPCISFKFLQTTEARPVVEWLVIKTQIG